MTRSIKPALAFLLLLQLASLAAPVAAQQPKIPAASGTEIFRRILHDLGCTPLARPRDISEDAPNKVIIVLGGTLLPWLQFADEGGSVLLAWDGGSSQHSFEEVNVTINPGPVAVQRNSKAAYLEGRGLFIEPTGRVPFGKDLADVATIRPGFLAINPPSLLETVAKLPPDARIRRAQIRQDQQVFAAGTESFRSGKGRVLIMADQGVFANALLWQREPRTKNDNFKFAQECALWLTESGRRKEILFYEAGKIVTDFDTKFIEEPPVPLPPIEDVVHAVNQGLSGIEEEDLFNEWLGSLARQVSTRMVIIVLSILVAAYGLIRLGLAKYHVEPAAPLLQAGMAQLVPSVDVAAQRKRWLLRHGNFAEAAQTLARQFFDNLEKAGWLPPLPKESSLEPPRVRSRAGWWQARRSRRDLRRLWQLAHAGRPRKVSARQLAALQASMARLRAALGQGTLVLEQPAGAPPFAPPRRSETV